MNETHDNPKETPDNKSLLSNESSLLGKSNDNPELNSKKIIEEDPSKTHNNPIEKPEINEQFIELTDQERKEMELVRERNRVALETKGLIRQDLFDHVIRTSAENISDILYDFRFSYKYPEEFSNVNPKQSRYGKNIIRFDLLLGSTFYEGSIGYIEVKPINDILSQVQIVKNPGQAPVTADGEKLYCSSLEFLKNLCTHLKKVFQISEHENDVSSNSQINQSNNTIAGLEKKIIQKNRIPVGKYDELCLKWVNRPYSPFDNKDEFLSKNESYMSKKTFDRILKDAFQRGVIDKGQGKNGRYKPRTVP
jgi:hypothetical protein